MQHDADQSASHVVQVMYAAAVAVQEDRRDDAHLLLTGVIEQSGPLVLLYALLSTSAEHLRRVAERRQVPAPQVLTVLRKAFADLAASDTLTLQILDAVADSYQFGSAALEANLYALITAHGPDAAIHRALDVLAGLLTWRARDQRTDPLAFTRRIVLTVALRAEPAATDAAGGE